MDGSGKVDMFNYMQKWLENDNTKVIYFLVLILIANMIDFVAGWINAKFNPNVSFSSSKAIFGIARKMILFILCVFFVPISLLVPYPVGIAALYVFLLGYLLSEINSILSHLKLSDDDKSTDKFSDFIKKVFSK
jgi:toxin secretion/phage lysis holin